METNVVDSSKLDEISWTIVAKRRNISKNKTLSDEELFIVWQSFNKINIDNDSVQIDIEEAANFLEEFMKSMGTPWTRGPLDDFVDGKIKLTFWEFVECLESKYIIKAPKRFDFFSRLNLGVINTFIVVLELLHPLT